jgi:hypothetical protein
MYRGAALCLARRILAHSFKYPHQHMSLDRPVILASTIDGLSTSGNTYWPVPMKRLRCYVCRASRFKRKISVKSR